MCGYWCDFVDGFGVFWCLVVILIVFVVFGFVMFVIGLINVLEIFFVECVLYGGVFGYGLLWIVIGVGFVVGSFVSGVLFELCDLIDIYLFVFLFWVVGIFVVVIL